MFKADTPATVAPFWTPARRAWTVMLTAFAIFCLLATSAGLAITRSLQTSPAPLFTAMVEQPDVVTFQRARSTQRVQVETSVELENGDSLYVAENAAPGVAASLSLSRGAMALWAKTTVRLDQRGSGKQPTQMSLLEGQLIVDLPADATPLRIDTGTARLVLLTPPGRYRVRKLEQGALTTALAESASLADPPRAEIAVEHGRALISPAVAADGKVVDATDEVPVLSGERVLFDGNLARFPNEWPLLRDGKFRDYPEVQYNNTMFPDLDVPKSDSWQVQVEQQTASGRLVPSGEFMLERDDCVSPVEVQACRTIATFKRQGTYEQSSITLIRQDVDADVAAYRQVQLSANIRIKWQSLSKGGVLGTECPVLIRVYYTNNENPRAQKDFCFWAYNWPRVKGEVSNHEWIETKQIPAREWFPFSVDLAAQLPNLQAIREIQIHANGHDYESNVADVSLDAVGLSDKPIAALVAPDAQQGENAPGVQR